jgi:hypothetical protein
MIAEMPNFAASSTLSRNGKKASDARTVFFKSSSGFVGAHRGDSDRINAVHLSGADSDGLRFIGENNRVRFDVFADFPGEKQSANLLRSAVFRKRFSNLLVILKSSRFCTSIPPEIVRYSSVFICVFLNAQNAQIFLFLKISSASGQIPAQARLR